MCCVSIGSSGTRRLFCLTLNSLIYLYRFLRAIFMFIVEGAATKKFGFLCRFKLEGITKQNFLISFVSFSLQRQDSCLFLTFSLQFSNLCITFSALVFRVQRTYIFPAAIFPRNSALCRSSLIVGNNLYDFISPLKCL